MDYSSVKFLKQGNKSMKYDQVMGMEITLQIGCPNNCTYCPQGTLLSKYQGVRSFTLESMENA